ncbi:MAG: phosphatase [Moraxellaceae bacterium]|jgi:protein-tyrosine phosphatase|nr:phosphatase [Moraxellaceae bacterium]
MSHDEDSPHRRQAAVAHALASLALEGRRAPPELRGRLEAYAAGEVAADTLVEEVLQRHQRKDPFLMPLIQEGALPVGTLLTCPVAGVTGHVTADGLSVEGEVFTDPTTAMGRVTGNTPPADAGWEFWKLDDPERGFTKPLEHVRVVHASQPAAATPRTSDSHPLRIHPLAVPGLVGEIGLTFCPGKKSDSLYGGRWERDLDKDLAVIRQWGTTAVVTVMERHEFGLLGVPEFPEVMAREPLQWHLLRIRDSDVPAPDFEDAWPAVSTELQSRLRRGERIVIHCRGGLGRTGLVAARLLIELGVPAKDAVQRIRDCRPGAIETWEQRMYLLDLPIVNR